MEEENEWEAGTCAFCDSYRPDTRLFGQVKKMRFCKECLYGPFCGDRNPKGGFPRRCKKRKEHRGKHGLPTYGDQW